MINQFTMLSTATLVLFLSSCRRGNLERYSMILDNPKYTDHQPGSVSVTYMGTTALLVSDGETSFMTDPFFTRGAALQREGASIRVTPSREIIATSLQRIGVENLDAVLVSHSHFDHALDAPEVALQTGAFVMGSESSLNIARGWGLTEDRLREVQSSRPMRLGHFTVTFIETDHGSFICNDNEGERSDDNDGGGGPLSGGAIERPLTFPARFGDFVEGDIYAIHIAHPTGSILFQPSAGARDGALEGHDADIVFLGIARVGNLDRSCQEAYFREVVEVTKARRVVPIHWDNWIRSLDEPLHPWTRAVSDFDGAMEFLLEQRRRGRIDELTLMRSWQTYRLE